MDSQSSLPKYWSSFSVILTCFKLFGVLPLSIDLAEDEGSAVQTEFSVAGSVMAVLLVSVTLFHATWGPQMLANLDHNMANDTRNPNRMNAKMEIAHVKISSFVQALYPWLGSVTSIAARLLGLFTTSESLPVLLKTICRADYLLPLPSRHSLSDLKRLTAFTVVGFLLHIPVIVAHTLRVSGYTNLVAKIWQMFSMMNVLTTFSVELQFLLLCWSIRSRFGYINSVLNIFVAREFHFEESRRQIAGGLFHRWKKFIKWQNRKIYVGDFKAKQNICAMSFFDSKPLGGTRNVEKQVDGLRVSRATTARLFRSLRRSHVLLHDAMDRLNHMYQFYMFLTILSSMVKFIVCCYYAIFGYLSAKTEASVRNGMPLIIIWCSYHCFRFLLLVNVAHYTVASSRQARTILSKIDWRDFELVCREEIKMFSHHLSRRNFQFSACGLFDINTSLISTLFSTTITYIVIMAQLH